jgi:hypothetical protein
MDFAKVRDNIIETRRRGREGRQYVTTPTA